LHRFPAGNHAVSTKAAFAKVAGNVLLEIPSLYNSDWSVDLYNENMPALFK
jgi:hypothetical protein